MQISNIKSPEIFTIWNKEIEGRLDSHFYRPEFIKLGDQIAKFRFDYLDNIINFSNETWNQKDIYDDMFPYIEISAVYIETGEIKDIVYLPKNDAPSRAKMLVKKDDIIVSTTRPHRGAIAYVDSSKNNFIVSTGFAVLRGLKTKKIQKSYLFEILRTNFCLNQMLQRSSGGNYPAITEEELKKVKIPIPSLDIQNKIVAIMQKAYKKNRKNQIESKKVLDSIDKYVLGELGIEMPEIKKKMIFTTWCNDVQNKRLDAEYNQEKYKILQKAVKRGKYKTARITEILDKINKGIEVGSSLYVLDGIPFIRVADINDDEIRYNETDKKISLELYKGLKKDYKPKIGEVLYTKDGSIGLSVVVEEDKDCIISSGVLRLKAKQGVNNYYIKAILSNKFFKLLAEHKSIGAVIRHLNMEEFENLKCPFPPIGIQNKIAKEARSCREKAKKLQQEAKELLNQAKRKVEELIEK